MYKVNEDILKTPVTDDSLLLLEPKAGLYFELNESSVVIFECLNKGLSKDEIIEKVLALYDVKKEQLQKDYDDLLEQMIENNVVIKKPA